LKLTTDKKYTEYIEYMKHKSLTIQHKQTGLVKTKVTYDTNN